MKKIDILVTGASGFIGRHFLDDNMLALVRKPYGFKNEIIGDLLNEDSLDKACKNIKIIFHCGGYSEATNDTILNKSVNFCGTKNLLKAAKNNLVKKIIYLSSIKTLSKNNVKSLHNYGYSKKKSEDEIIKFGKKYKIHITILRLPIVYAKNSNSNLNKMFHAINKGWFPPIPENNNKRAIIFINDVITAMHLVSKNSSTFGKIYNLNDGAVYSTRDIYSEICYTLGKKVPIWSVPKILFFAFGYLGTILEIITRLKFGFNIDIIKKLFESSWYCSKLIQKDLKWKPKYNLKKGLQEIIDHEKIF